MSFQVITNLTPKEKARKSEEAKKWLQEQGELPDLNQLRNILIEARSLTQSLTNGLHEQEQNGLAAAKLAAHIEELIQTIQ